MVLAIKTVFQERLLLRGSMQGINLYSKCSNYSTIEKAKHEWYQYKCFLWYVVRGQQTESTKVAEIA